MNTPKTAWAVVSRYAGDTTTSCELYASFKKAVENVLYEYEFYMNDNDYPDEYRHANAASKEEVAQMRKEIKDNHHVEFGDWEYNIIEVSIPDNI